MTETEVGIPHTLDEILVHSSTCLTEDCNYGAPCRQMKQLTQHIQICEAQSCIICTDVNKLIVDHSLTCKDYACCVPKCISIRSVINSRSPRDASSPSMRRCSSPEIIRSRDLNNDRARSAVSYSYPLPNRCRPETGSNEPLVFRSAAENNFNCVINLPSAVILSEKKQTNKSAPTKDPLLSLPARPLHQRSYDDNDSDLDIVAQNKIKSKVAKKAIKKLTKTFSEKMGTIPLSPLSRPSECNTNEIPSKSLSRTRSFSEFSETSSMSSAASYTGDGLDTEDEGTQKRVRLTPCTSCRSNASINSHTSCIADFCPKLSSLQTWDFEPILSDFDHLQLDNTLFDNDELIETCTYGSTKPSLHLSSASYDHVQAEPVEDLTISHISCTTEEYHGLVGISSVAQVQLPSGKNFNTESKYLKSEVNEEKLTMTVFDEEDEIFGFLLQDDFQFSVETR